MIRTFADRQTAAVFAGHFVRGLPSQIQRRARAKLLMIDAAGRIGDLRAPPGNRLEALRGDRQGQHSVRINDQWRICFRWSDGEAWDVEILDYHRPGCMMTINRQDVDRKVVDFTDVAGQERLPPVHPGEILRDEFLRPCGLSVYRLAQALRIPRPRLNEIVLGKRRVTTDTALRLARYFGTTPEFWIRLQVRYDLDEAEPARREIEREIQPHGAFVG